MFLAVTADSALRQADDSTLAIWLWARGDLRCFPSLITEQIRLEDAPGVALASGEEADSIKTIIQFD